METMDYQKNKEEEETSTNGSNEPAPIEDIDPRQWLTSSDEEIFAYVKTRAGRLKIAALTEAETDVVRRRSERPINPGKPQQGMKVDLKRFRTNMACESLNKAYKDKPGYQPLLPNELEKKLAGEITTIIDKVTEISGYKEDEGDPLANFPSIS